MEMNNLVARINSLNSSASKNEVNSKKSDNTFNNLMQRLSNTKENNSLKDSGNIRNSKLSSAKDKVDDVREDNEPNDADKAKMLQEGKKTLKEAGVKDEDLDKIKDLDSLKEFVVEKCVGEDSEDIDLSKIMELLASMMNLNPQELQQTKQALTENIKNVLTEALNQAGGNEQKLSELMNSLKDQIKDILNKGTEKFGDNVVKTLLGKEASEDALKMIKDLLPQEDKIKQSFKSALHDSLKDVCKDSKGTEEALVQFKSTTKETVLNNNLANSNSNGKDSSQNKDSKENSFLKSLAGESKADNNFKATTFGVANFNNTINNVQEAENNVVINKTTMTNDIIKALKYMETNNMKNLTIKITPHDLGEVIIKVTMQGGVMKADITATNKEAYNLLNSNLQDLTNKLHTNEVKIQDVSLNVYSEDTTFFKDGAKENKENQKGKEKKTKGIDGVGGDLSSVEEIINESTIDSNVDILA